jgi:hypothetical protein
MSDKKFICTYFDYNFLPRGLALYYSVKRFHKEFSFYVLTFDKETYDYLSALNEDNLFLISNEEYDDYFKTSVSRFPDKKQYYFTATPGIFIYLFAKYPEIDILLYLDADVYVYNALEPIYTEFGDASIGFCSHRLHPLVKLFSNSYGKYNVGVNLFRNSAAGQKCLKEWKADCDNWYPGQPGYKLKYFSDQIFLDSWVGRYDGIKIIENIGVDTSHWNAANYRFSKKNEKYFVDEYPLIIYHFSNLIKVEDSIWNANSIYAFVSIKGILYEIYKNYLIDIESFGLSNRKWIKVKLKVSARKRLFHAIMKRFINEIIDLK